MLQGMCMCAHFCIYVFIVFFIYIYIQSHKIHLQRTKLSLLPFT